MKKLREFTLRCAVGSTDCDTLAKELKLKLSKAKINFYQEEMKRKDN